RSQLRNVPLRHRRSLLDGRRCRAHKSRVVPRPFGGNIMLARVAGVPRDCEGTHNPRRRVGVPMNERELRNLIAAVKAGRLSRRALLHRMVGLGLSAPFASQLLARAGLAQAPTGAGYKPTKAGGGGTLKMLVWQGPTLLNPHFATGTKDQEGS